MTKRMSSVSFCAFVLWSSNALASCRAFIPPYESFLNNMRIPSRLYSVASQTVDTLILEGDVNSVQEAATFMVDAFWIGDSRVHQSSGSLSESSKQDLINEQVADFTEKYGERMGKRLLESCLIAAVDDESREMLGLVSLEVSILDRSKGDILSAEIAESLLKNTVASLGPKQRREYKDSSVMEIVDHLLPAEQEAVCCLSNLAISPNARRRGIAMKLCTEAEKIAQGEGFDALYLKVEKENEPACKLYQDKLGYELVYVIENAAAVRLDIDKGCFQESEADTLVLKKLM